MFCQDKKRNTLTLALNILKKIPATYAFQASPAFHYIDRYHDFKT